MKSTEKTPVHTQPKTATERLEAIEKQLAQVTEAVNGLVDANRTLALQAASLTLALNGEKKRNNTLRAELGALIEIMGDGGPITRENVKQRVIEASVAELKRKVDELLVNGVLVPTEEIAEDSFVVGHQEDRDGNVVNKRIQFLVSTFDPETQAKILSKKAGETVDLGEDQPLLYILEVYKDMSSGGEAETENTPA
jgi:hypothetical protein